MSRAVPYNEDVEAFVLGCSLISAQARSAALRMLKPSDFYRPQHRVLFGAVKSMQDAGLADVDEYTVRDFLKASGDLEAAGGKLETITLTQRVPAIANHKAYIDEVRAVAIRRSVVDVAHRLEERACSEDSRTEDAVNAAELAVCELRERMTDTTPRGTIAAIDAMCDDLMSGEDLDTIPFPLQRITDIGGGQLKGEVVVTGGMSGDGKSWWGLDCAEIAVNQQRRTAYYSLEMPAKQCIARLAAMGGHSLTAIRKRTINVDELAPRVQQLRNMAKSLDIFDGSVSVGRVAGDLMRARMSGKPYRYVVLDHLHLLDLPDATRAGEYRIALNQTLTHFKRLAVEHGCTIHLLAQLRRPNERKIEPPRMSDLKESSAIEQIADYVLFVYRNRDEESGMVKPTGQLIVAKARDGEGIGKVEVEFDTTRFRFRPSMGMAA